MARRRHKAAHRGSHERWLITYADLVTLLFALFIVLFANSDVNEGKFGKAAESIRRAFDIGIGVIGGAGSQPGIFPEGAGSLVPSVGQVTANDIQIVGKQLSALTENSGYLEQVQVTTQNGQITVSLSSNLLFSPASAILSEKAKPFLLKLGTLLATLPNEIRVEGHTDNIPVTSGEFPTNWELSTARATAVLRFLMDEAGVKPERVYAAGFGDTRPIADNGTPEGRAHNRRADIVIIYPQQGAPASPDAPPDLSPTAPPAPGGEE